MLFKILFWFFIIIFVHEGSYFCKNHQHCEAKITVKLNGIESRISIDAIKISKRTKLDGAIVHDGFDHPSFNEILLCSKDGETFWLRAADVPDNLIANYLDKMGSLKDGNIKKAKFYFEQKFKTGGM